MDFMHKPPMRFTFAVTSTYEAEQIEAELDMMVEHMHGYITRTVVEFPETVTIYVDAYPQDLAVFLDFVENSPIEQYKGWT